MIEKMNSIGGSGCWKMVIIIIQSLPLLPPPSPLSPYSKINI